MKTTSFALCVLLFSLMPKTGFAKPADFTSTIQPFFARYCSRCHNEKQQEGEFRLDTLPRNFTDESIAQRWDEVIFRMNSGEMPPKDEPLPKSEELGRVVDWLSARVSEGRAARMAKGGPVSHYRLSRDEYANTVGDLLGVRFDVHMPGVFNEDPRWHGFDRIGSMLSLAPSHVERYIKAAETVLGRAFANSPPKVRKRRYEPGFLKINRKDTDTRYRWIYYPGRVGPHIHTEAQGAQVRVRIQLSGLQPFGDRAPHLTVWDFVLKRSVFDEDIVTAEDRPVIVEFVTMSPSFQIMNDTKGHFARHTLSMTSSVLISSRDRRGRRPTGYMMFDDDGRPIYPLLLIDWIEYETVATGEADLKKREGLVPATEGDPAETHECIKQFATRAWRRPATDIEVTRYLKIVEDELAAGASFQAAYRAAMVGILSSKNFYYITEGSTTDQRNHLNGWELASRLSYFLWSSMPDNELLAAARNGTLRKPDQLRIQLNRMLGAEKIRRLSDSFPKQWLQLHRVGMFPPDPGLYPDYDKWLERSMVLETTNFFSEVFSRNLSIREFLISDWTMVNPRLALHYRMPELTTSGFQRVLLKPEYRRGGVLTQASILSLTSDGTRHRPVHRGVWISEAIFGRTPPSPPPNVEPLAPTPSNKPKATLRQQLEAHTTHTVCASCHRKIDPLGFALDNYNAIGQWRTVERVRGGQGENPPVVSGGELPDSRKFNSPEEFKQLLAQDIHRFAEAFIEQLATYALRRVMTIDDRDQIKAIVAASKKDDFRIRTVIENLVTSELFQKR